MEYEVALERVAPRQLAAVRGEAGSRAEIGRVIIELLDKVWPVLRGQGVKTDHNVVVYYGSPFRLAAGVEVPDGFEPTEVVQPLSTPVGEAAVVVHIGEYSAMQGAYAALDQWFTANGRRPGGISWEVYGDWHEDPALLRTDIYMLVAPRS